jgi:hypothetical protein
MVDFRHRTKTRKKRLTRRLIGSVRARALVDDSLGIAMKKAGWYTPGNINPTTRII